MVIKGVAHRHAAGPNGFCHLGKVGISDLSSRFLQGSTVLSMIRLNIALFNGERKAKSVSELRNIARICLRLGPSQLVIQMGDM
jgi:hypothetical protein